jgi:hypothetical protein
MPTLHFPPNTLTIGADPEFTIHSSNNPTERDNFIPALRILPDPHYNNKLGHDGCSSTGELRPTPSTDPFRVYQSLDKIIHRLGKLHNDKRFFTSGVTSNPVGGHIHFGNLPFTSDQIKAITRSLDSLLFPVIFCLENENYSLERRGRSNYGKPGDIRNQPHGFEYRPLASWITSPITTKGTLATAYAIADETLKAKLPLSRNLPTPALLSNLVRMENSQRLVRKLIPDIGKTIRKTSHYRQDTRYKKSIDKLLWYAVRNQPLLDKELLLSWHIRRKHITPFSTLITNSDIINLWNNNPTFSIANIYMMNYRFFRGKDNHDFTNEITSHINWLLYNLDSQHREIDLEAITRIVRQPFLIKGISPNKGSKKRRTSVFYDNRNRFYRRFIDYLIFNNISFTSFDIRELKIKKDDDTEKERSIYLPWHFRTVDKKKITLLLFLAFLGEYCQDKLSGNFNITTIFNSFNWRI